MNGNEIPTFFNSGYSASSVVKSSSGYSNWWVLDLVAEAVAFAEGFDCDGGGHGIRASCFVLRLIKLCHVWPVT